MSADDFLDTNVFVYLFDKADAAKRRQAEMLVNESLSRGTGCISFQVVQETVNALTGKFGVSADRVRRLLDYVLVPLWQINATTSLYQSAISLRSQYSFSFYDSLIVAAALEAGGTRLYSEALQHRQRIQRMTIINPFRVRQ